MKEGKEFPRSLRVKRIFWDMCWKKIVDSFFDFSKFHSTLLQSDLRSHTHSLGLLSCWSCSMAKQETKKGQKRPKSTFDDDENPVATKKLKKSVSSSSKDEHLWLFHIQEEGEGVDGAAEVTSGEFLYRTESKAQEAAIKELRNMLVERCHDDKAEIDAELDKPGKSLEEQLEFLNEYVENIDQGRIGWRLFATVKRATVAA